jgi:very-short-patch-repair endonuclease
MCGRPTAVDSAAQPSGRPAPLCCMPFARVPPQLTVGPFTSSEAAKYGVSNSSLRHPQWRHPFREVWVHRSVPDTREVRLSAVRLILRGQAFICGLTAAWLYGIDVQDRRSDLVWVGHPTGYRPRARAGTLVREITVDGSDVTTLGGLPITTRLRTVFDCARWLSIVEAVVVADFFARVGAVAMTDIAAYAASHRGLRGSRQVDRVIKLMDGRSESPMETRLRLLLVFAGLDWLEPQFEVFDKLGRFVARADLAFIAQRVIVEYDGADHWAQRRDDDRRRDALRALGWTVIVVSSEDYYKTPDALIAKIRSALNAARS